MISLAIIFGRITAQAVRFSGSRGTAFPGKLVDKVFPSFLANIAAKAPKTIIITGTNGKTTTTKLIVEVLKKANYSVATNSSGSNMPRGIISSLLNEVTLTGVLRKDWLVIEVDEGYVADVAALFKPEFLVVTNIYRDQLDRYGELDGAAKKVIKASAHAKKTIYYGRDPLLSKIADISGPEIVTFNVERKYYSILPLDNSQTELTDVTSNYTLKKIQQKGNIQLLSIEHKKSSVELSTKLLGAYNALNILAAYCLANELGVKLEAAKTALAEVEPLFGRGETLQYKNKSISIELVKNPTGFNQVISNLMIKDQPILFLINDKLADGRDVSWLWDVDLDRLGHLRSDFLTGGSRGLDMQLRLRYAGIKADYTNAGVKEAIMVFLESGSEKSELTIVATYTAMLEARDVLKEEEK